MPHDDLTDAGSSPTAAEAMETIRAQQASSRRALEPSTELLLGVWGVAFAVGYLALHTGYDPERQAPDGWSFLVFAVCIAGAMVVTAVHIARRTRGIRGTSARAGAMYGWAWAVAFVMASVIFTAASRAGAPPLVMSTLTNSVSLLIVATLYMAGAALWQEWRMFALGVWFAVVGSVAALVLPPTAYLVQALAGGGGFLVGAVVGLVLARRRTA